MPKNEACPGVPPVTGTITAQEIAFAHLVLSGTMTDRYAAETAGLHPDSAADTLSRPPVHAYIQKHQEAVQEERIEQAPRRSSPLQRDPRSDPRPPLGNRQHEPGNHPRQPFRTSEGPLHDYRHRRPDPRSPSRFRPQQTHPSPGNGEYLPIRLARRPANRRK